jgi:hypothetical protein
MFFIPVIYNNKYNVLSKTINIVFTFYSLYSIALLRVSVLFNLQQNQLYKTSISSLGPMQLYQRINHHGHGAGKTFLGY